MLKSKIDISNLFDFDSLASLKSAIESNFTISITSISFTSEQDQVLYLHPCQTEQDYSQYLVFKQQSIDQIGHFHYEFSPLHPLDFEILSISGSPDLISVNPNTLIHKTWILKSKARFNLLCIEGELQGHSIEPSSIKDEILQFDLSFSPEGSSKLTMLYFKAQTLYNALFGPMLWASAVIL